MSSNNQKYTTPVLRKGPNIVAVPKGSNKVIEQAKKNWYVEYYFLNPETGKMDRIRVTNNFNRIKDPKVKLDKFNALKEEYCELLKAGFSPFSDNQHLKENLIGATLAEAQQDFIKYHTDKKSRPSTLIAFKSKTKLLLEYFGEDKKIKDIKTEDIINLMLHYEGQRSWSGKTFMNTKLALVNFFNFLKNTGKISITPFDGFTESRKIQQSNSHQLFNDTDFDLIKIWLTQNDPYTLLFIQLIYYTCARPNELRFLQLKDVDMADKKITIPSNISKNKKTDTINIDSELFSILIKLNLDNYPKEFYLTGSIKHFIDEKPQPAKSAYNRFQKCLAQLNLKGKNYTLYSAKHLSNVRKRRDGWTLEEIQKANRHSSISQTEIYLRDLMKDVKIIKNMPKM